MTIDKFNKIVKSIIFTSIALVILYFIGYGLIEVFKTNKKNNRKSNTTEMNSLPVSKPTHDSLSIKEEKKYVSFYNPTILDTLEKTYIVPVGNTHQKTNKSKNRRYSRSELSIFSDTADTDDYYDFDYLHYFYEGVYNNFVIYNDKKQTSIKVFDDKSIISNWFYDSKINSDLIVFKGTQQDSNSDNIFDSNDFQMIYTYSIKKNKMNKIKFDNKTVLKIKRLSKSNKLLILLGVDINNDKKFSNKFEPKEYVLLNLNSLKLTELVSPKLRDEIQNIIE